MEERNLITGMITSTEFLHQVKDFIDVKLIQSKTAKRMASWVMEYYRQYNVAPGKDIGDIFYSRAKNLPEEVVEDIEEILEDLSEYSDKNPAINNIPYLVEQTKIYFTSLNMEKRAKDILALLAKGEHTKAEALYSNYKPLMKEAKDWVEFGDEKFEKIIDQAFADVAENLIEFPGPMGEFLNEHLVRSGFVGFLAIEKAGKTWLLLEFIMRAIKQGRNVAFMQAGDMTTTQQAMRISIYLAKRSNKEKYCGTMYEPVRDCIHNQMDTCVKEDRAGTFGCFSDKTDKYLREELTMDELKEAYEEFTDYQPCTDCDEYERNKWGIPWLKKVHVDGPLTAKEAREIREKFLAKNKGRLRIATYSTGTLTVEESDAVLDVWEKEGFIADVVVWDYPDIMAETHEKEYRHKQNRIWMGIRGITQKRKVLGIVVTQADAKAYNKLVLDLTNFSEDKRKYAHPTAFFGINHDKHGREKEIGIMRLNTLVLREGDFNPKWQVHILQNIKRGRPFITSYF